MNPSTSFSLLVIVMGIWVKSQPSSCSNPLSQYFNGKLYRSQVVSTATDCQQSASLLVKRAVGQYWHSAAPKPAGFWKQHFRTLRFSLSLPPVLMCPACCCHCSVSASLKRHSFIQQNPWLMKAQCSYFLKLFSQCFGHVNPVDTLLSLHSQVNNHKFTVNLLLFH